MGPSFRGVKVSIVDCQSTGGGSTSPRERVSDEEKKLTRAEKRSKKVKSSLYSNSRMRSKGVKPCNQCHNNPEKRMKCKWCEYKGYIPNV